MLAAYNLSEQAQTAVCNYCWTWQDVGKPLSSDICPRQFGNAFDLLLFVVSLGVLAAAWWLNPKGNVDG
jgi:hypothetical protein